jgi:peptidoglycan/LPS O-acetylase OafA/YrhL
MPTAEEAGDSARQAPGTVRYSFVAWILAALIGLANAVLMLAFKQSLIDIAIKNNKNPNVTNEQIASGTTTLLWMFLVGSVVFGALFVLFAYKAQAGVRRARMLLTVLCVITVLYYFLILRTTLGLMAALLALTATVLLYTPKAGEHFRSRD